MHSACSGLCLEEPGIPVPTCRCVVRAIVLFAIIAINCKISCLDNRVEGTGGEIPASGVPASHDPSLPAVCPSMEPLT